MRIVAISRLLDEIDIIEAFVRHTAAYVDHHVFMDNGSEDGTLEILSSLQAEGLGITVFQNKCVSFNEANHLTFLFREAIRTLSPDWVLCLDADEFIDDRSEPGGLRRRLDIIDTDPKAIGIRLPMVVYAATREDDTSEAVIPLRMRMRREPTHNCKVLVRANPAFEIREGGHSVGQGDHPGYVAYQTNIRLAHFAERSQYQYILKFARGWNKVLAASEEVMKSGLSRHYQRPYEILLDDPARFLRGDALWFKDDPRKLTLDPIAYLGGGLRYTPAHDDAMHTVQGLMRAMRDLALRHGALIDAMPEVKAMVADWDQRCEKLF